MRKKDVLTIAILTNHPGSSATSAFETEILNTGHRPLVIDAQDAWVRLSDADGRDNLFIRPFGAKKSERILAKDIDACVVRIAGSYTSYALYILRHFQNLGIFCTLQDYSVMVSSDKFWTAQIASRIRVWVPRQLLSLNR